MKYISLFVVFLFFSCGNKEDILLPKANVTIVKDIQDHSPIYIFFRKKGKDTLAEVNRKNSIITTNWILNIDKRLPLRIVIPEVMKLQEKKRKEKAHKNEKAGNYYSYADSIHKNLAFLPFTEVYYTIGKPETGSMILSFRKGRNSIFIDDSEVKKAEILNYIYSIAHVVQPKIIFVFDKNMSFEEYIQNKILVRKLYSYNDDVPKEFIF